MRVLKTRISNPWIVDDGERGTEALLYLEDYVAQLRRSMKVFGSYVLPRASCRSSRLEVHSRIGPVIVRSRRVADPNSCSISRRSSRILMETEAFVFLSRFSITQRAAS